MIREIDFDRNNVELVKKLNDNGFFNDGKNENSLLNDLKENVKALLPKNSVVEYQVILMLYYFIK